MGVQTECGEDRCVKFKSLKDIYEKCLVLQREHQLFNEEIARKIVEGELSASDRTWVCCCEDVLQTTTTVTLIQCLQDCIDWRKRELRNREDLKKHSTHAKFIKQCNAWMEVVDERQLREILRNATVPVTVIYGRENEINLL